MPATTEDAVDDASTYTLSVATEPVPVAVVWNASARPAVLLSVLGSTVWSPTTTTDVAWEADDPPRIAPTSTSKTNTSRRLLTRGLYDCAAPTRNGRSSRRSLPARLGLPHLAAQVRLQPVGRRAHRRDLVLALREAVPFVLEDDVLDGASERAQLLDELVGFALDDARILRTLDHEQGRLLVLDVRERRPLAQEVGVLLGIADELPHHALPRRRHRLRERDQVRRSEDVDRGSPVVRQPRHAREHGEPAVRAAPDADPLRVDPVLRVQPLDGVLPVLHVAAAPVALDEPLVALAVAGRAPDVRREHGDSPARQVLVERAVDR